MQITAIGLYPYSAPLHVVMPVGRSQALRSQFRGPERMFIRHLASEFPRRPLLGNLVNKRWLSTFSQTEGFQYWPFAENSSTPQGSGVVVGGVCRRLLTFYSASLMPVERGYGSRNLGSRRKRRRPRRSPTSSLGMRTTSSATAEIAIAIRSGRIPA
jgi:hypothetical protein